MDNNIEVEEQKDLYPALATFAYHDLDDIGDGRGEELIWITKEEYEKIEEYYAHPYAHFIGVMINFELPRIREMVEELVSSYAKDIFIEEILLDVDPETILL